jgi:hypothetical protein
MKADSKNWSRPVSQIGFLEPMKPYTFQIRAKAEYGLKRWAEADFCPFLPQKPVKAAYRLRNQIGRQ